MKAPASYILSFAEYGRVQHAVPYVVEVQRGRSHLMLFGGLHSSDPAQPMFGQIESAFRRFQPTYVLHEGTPPYPEPEREIAIRRHGEAGLLCHLALHAGVETASLDLPLEEEARILCGEMAARDVLVFLVVRQLASFNRKTARLDFQGYFRDFFARIEPALGLGKLDWPSIEAEHVRLVGTPLQARRVTGHQTDPMRDELPTQRIARRSNRLRDEHMLSCLAKALEEQARTLAVVGVTHAVMLEPALRATAL
jgi:hypothetical protein